jgi:hypothetical protein
LPIHRVIIATKSIRCAFCGQTATAYFEPERRGAPIGCCQGCAVDTLQALAVSACVGAHAEQKVMPGLMNVWEQLAANSWSDQETKLLGPHVRRRADHSTARILRKQLGRKAAGRLKEAADHLHDLAGLPDDKWGKSHRANCKTHARALDWLAGAVDLNASLGAHNGQDDTTPANAAK